MPSASRARVTPAAASSPKALPPVSRMACTSCIMQSGSSRLVSRVAGAPPRTSTAPTAGATQRTTVQPVAASRSLSWPTRMPGTSQMSSWRGRGSGMAGGSSHGVIVSLSRVTHAALHAGEDAHADSHAAFFGVAHGVSYLDIGIRAHEQRDSRTWRDPGVGGRWGRGLRALQPGGELGSGGPRKLTEAGGNDERAHLVGRQQEAIGGIVGPGDGEVDGLIRPRHHIIEGEASAGFEHTIRLAIEARLVADVHRGVLGPYHIEGAVAKGHIERAAAHERDAVAEMGPAGERFAGLAECRCQVQHSDGAAVAAGEQD